MANLTKNEQAVIKALTASKAPMTAGEVASATGVAGAALSELVKGLMGKGLVVGEGKQIKLAPVKKTAPAVAAKAKVSAPAPATAKVKVAPKPAPEPEPEVEEEEEAQYTQEELDAFIEEYNDLSDGRTLNKKDKARLDAITVVLTENGCFGPDGEGAEEEEEAPEEDEDFDFEEDVPEEDETEDDEDEHGDDDEEEEEAPAKSKVKGASKVAPADSVFSIPFKPIDQLTKPELEAAIEEAVMVAESVHEQGFAWAADFLMRSLAKARKQLAKR